MKHARTRSLLAATFATALLFSAGHVLADNPPNEPEENAQNDSSQPVTDTWITTKVKADLLATENVSGLDIKVETVDGVVTLSGAVDSQAQKDKDLLQEIILAEGLTPVYQPIVHLDSGDIFGFEALARGPRKSPLEAPLALFSVAEEVNLLFELDRACFRGALRGAHRGLRGKRAGDRHGVKAHGRAPCRTKWLSCAPATARTTARAAAPTARRPAAAWCAAC